MFAEQVRRRCRFLLFLALIQPANGTQLSARADELTLKNGMVLNGATRQVAGLNEAGVRANGNNFAYWVLDDNVRRFFIHRRIVAKTDDDAVLGKNVSFKLKHEKSARTSGFPTVGGFNTIQPFSEYGRRTISLATQKGAVNVIQGIKDMNPQTAQLESLTHVWDYSVDTMTIPPNVIRAVIEKTSDRNDPNERKAAVLFYLQAQMYEDAQREIQQLSQRFPDLSGWCEEYQRLVGDYIARKAVNEIERRREAGQHRLAYQYSRQFPEEHVSADIRQVAMDVARQYEQAIEDRDRVLLQLDVLQATLPEEQFARLKSLRASLQEELHYETLPRLVPFLRAEEDETLPASQKLALAYSGWLLGDAGAILDLDEAIRLWDVRFLVLEYLRLNQDPSRETEILNQIESTEGIGMERMTQLLARLPLPYEPPQTAPGTVHEIEVPATPEQIASKYSIILPPEYTPAHRYPLLVVLRGERSSFENEARWWAGSAEQPGWAMRRGYIVIAPHYCPADAQGYDPGFQEHAAVLQSIEHARKRFRIDSDRIFLAGHGMGADACFDMGMSHPGLFAGVIPISGICPDFCRPCWKNAPQLAWYVVSGQRDRNALEKNAPVLNDMMRNGQQVIYCEYKERGYETYFEEQERLFTWMQPLRRSPLKSSVEFNAVSMRPSNNQFYWFQAKQLQDRPVGSNGKPRPAKYEGDIAPGGGIYISHPGKATTIWLSPELYDFSKKCEVRVNLKYVLSDYLKPSLSAMLSDLRERGDRERLYWVRLDL